MVAEQGSGNVEYIFSYSETVQGRRTDLQFDSKWKLKMRIPLKRLLLIVIGCVENEVIGRCCRGRAIYSSAGWNICSRLLHPRSLLI